MQRTSERAAQNARRTRGQAASAGYLPLQAVRKFQARVESGCGARASGVVCSVASRLRRKASRRATDCAWRRTVSTSAFFSATSRASASS